MVMVGRYGLWSGVVAVVGDADMYCVPCAKRRYGNAIQAVIDGSSGYERFTDYEGNPLSVVLYGSEDLRGMCCGSCFTLLDDEDEYEWQAMT
jgi:hypothetical protein